MCHLHTVYAILFQPFTHSGDIIHYCACPLLLVKAPILGHTHNTNVYEYHTREHASLVQYQCASSSLNVQFLRFHCNKTKKMKNEMWKNK